MTFGKKTQKLIKKTFSERVKLKKINKDLVIIKNVSEKKVGQWIAIKNQNGVIIVD